jgi:hypothetical protein
VTAAEDWSQRVIDAALDVSKVAPDGGFAVSVGESVGRILILLGRAAGHADRIAASGRAGDQARSHFRSEMQQVGQVALGLLQESWRRQQRPSRGNEEITDEIARQRVLTGKAPRRQDHPIPAGHAAAGLGAAIAAIGKAVRTIPLDDENLPKLDEPLQSVLAHAIAALARSYQHAGY